jgi:hypothetical protein
MQSLYIIMVAGNIFVADWGNNVIRIIYTNGSVSTYAGTVNDIVPTVTLLQPIGLTQGSFGNIIVSTLDRILKIKNVIKVTSTIARISKNANSIQASRSYSTIALRQLLSTVNSVSSTPIVNPKTIYYIETRSSAIKYPKETTTISLLYLKTNISMPVIDPKANEKFTNSTKEGYFENELPLASIYFSRLKTSSGDVITILLGLGYGELYELVNLLFYQMHKCKSRMFQITTAATSLLIASLTFHSIIADYQLCPYLVSDGVLALWALLCGGLDKFNEYSDIHLYLLAALDVL